jgi:hypothetical protein
VPELLLTETSADGYRAFGAEITLPLTGVTVVFGANNSGKTAVARLPLFALASLGGSDLLALRHRGISFAPDFRSLANLDEPHPRLGWAVRWRSPRGQHHAGVVLQLVSTQDGEHLVPLEIDVDSERVHRSKIDARDAWAGVREHPKINWLREQARALLSGMIHIPSARPGVEPVYHLRGPLDPTSITADDVPHLLASTPELLEAVSTWFAGALGHRVGVDQAAFAFRLVTRTAGGATVNMSAAGRGSQSALSVVTLFEAVRLGVISAKHVIVEEPEAHLHPSAHPSLGDLMLSTQAAGTVILAETHSQGVILRLRRRVAERKVSPGIVSLIYVDTKDRPPLRVIPIHGAGAVPDWPAGVFEYDLPEVEAIAEKMFAN